MSLQVFLQAQLLGSPEFLGRPASSPDLQDDDKVFLGRCSWLTLFCEVLPRALLAELSLSRILLGSATAEQFLLVLAEEDVPRANDLLSRTAIAIDELSDGTLRLAWATTENLGLWPVVRKRLDDALAANIATALVNRSSTESFFQPFSSNQASHGNEYFLGLASGLLTAQSVGWSPDKPALLSWGGGLHSWALVEQASADLDAIVFARRIAQDDFSHPAPMSELAARAEGAQKWGVLLADVDHFGAQLRRQASVEEHIHLSILFKEFFAGELSVLCTLPEFWRKVTVLYRGGNNFAVAGSWDALLSLAREIQRLFARFAEDNLATAANQDGKTISMALAIAHDADDTPSSLMSEASAQLREAKTAGVDSFHLFGRTLEWKRLVDAEELKTSLVRLVTRHGYSPNYIHDLASVYRESSSASRSMPSRRKAPRIDKPWRTYLRLAQVIPQARGKELNNLRNTVIASLIGKRTTALKLRPSGRVGLEWARLATGTAEALG